MSIIANIIRNVIRVRLMASPITEHPQGWSATVVRI